MTTYQYFCGNCGKHFASEKPERDSKGCLNEIPLSEWEEGAE